ncbi:MAG: hypothetical protein JXP34_20770, partial [Planctomycetes bacterium]|nr:hypothetical protein [Planctomycetota bacterium]
MRRTIRILLAVGSLAALGAAPEPAPRVVVGHVADVGRWNVFDGMAGAVLISPGGVLASSDESLRTQGRFAADAVRSLGFVAVNVSAGDFRLGLGTVRELAAAGPFISSNLSDRDGKPLARPFVIQTVGTVRLGIAGVAFPSPGDAPPYLADVVFTDPSVMLPVVGKALEAVSDLRVLLVHGDPRDAARLLRGNPTFQLAIVPGGVSPDARPIEIGAARLLLSPSGGEVSMTHEVSLPPGAGIRVASGERHAPAPAGAGPLDAVYTKHGLSENPIEAVARAQEDKTPAPAPEETLPARLEPGATVAVNRTGANRAVRLTIGTLRQTDAYGTFRAPAGEALLVLSTEWENTIPLTLVREKKVPTEYRIPVLGDHAYLVVDGKRVARILEGAEDLPGHVPAKDFGLERIGTRIRGNLVFRVRAGAVEDLTFRFYDFAHGFIALPLVGRREAAPAPAPTARGKNEVVEMAVHGLRKAAERGGAKAPEGMVFVEVDLRGRSLFTIKGDASAFDPKAKKGATISIGTVADWKESRRYLQLVADGEYAYAPLPESTLPEEPRFLPDLPTG